MIVNFMNLFDCPKILMGDFNLLPDTESIKIIEAAGLRNLIKEFGITETRTELYKKKLRFADYAFVSPEIKVKDFKVLPDVVSDHSPQYLDFEI
jgi:endonuclease/exonuclease/phosphatase family metal-dependent hydrolase